MSSHSMEEDAYASEEEVDGDRFMEEEEEDNYMEGDDFDLEPAISAAPYVSYPRPAVPFTPAFFHGGLNLQGDQSETTFACQSFARIPTIEMSKIDMLNNGGRIILPHSMLEKVIGYNDEVTVFRISDASGQRQLHAGVFEYTAEEGTVHLPYWMMNVLGLDEDSWVKIRRVQLPKGDFVKLQPLELEFLEITDPRAVLEKALKNYYTLTEGDLVHFNYNNRDYRLKVVEVKPKGAGRGILTLNVDLEVDFAPPDGYKEPTRPSSSASGPLGINQPPPPPAVHEQSKRFHAFRGAGQKLRGNSESSNASRSSTPIPVTSQSKPVATGNNNDDNGGRNLGDPPPVLDVPMGRLFFGYQIVPYVDPDIAAVDQDKDNQAVKKFTGQGRTLREIRKKAKDTDN